MTRAVARAVVLAVTAVACGAGERVAPPAGVQAVAIAAPVNRTGRDLVISGKADLAALLGRSKRTVMDVVAATLDEELRGRGFDVVRSGGDADVLAVTINRFDASTPDLTYVNAAITARLTARDGHELWLWRRDPWTLATNGAVNISDAWNIAARTAARELVADWTPAR